MAKTVSNVNQLMKQLLAYICIFQWLISEKLENAQDYLNLPSQAVGTSGTVSVSSGSTQRAPRRLCVLSEI